MRILMMSCTYDLVFYTGCAFNILIVHCPARLPTLADACPARRGQRHAQVAGDRVCPCPCPRPHYLLQNSNFITTIRRISLSLSSHR